MKKNVLLTLFLLLEMPTIQSLQAQWIQFGNLNNQDIHTITFYKGKYFCGTSDGIYVYSNSSMNWDPVINSPQQYISMLVSNDNHIFAAGLYSGGIYSSADSGKNWEPRNNGLSNLNVRALIINDDWIFAGTDYDYITPNSGVYRSTNNGEEWSYSNNGLSSISTINAFTICQNKIFATSVYFVPPGPSVSGGVYISTDNGEIWNSVNSGLINYNVNCLANIPVNDTNFSKIFVSDKLNPGGQTPSGAHLSTNFGQNWITANNGIENKAIISFAVYVNKLFALSDDNNIYVTSNYGANWISVDNIGLPITQFNSISIIDDELYLTTNAHGIWKRPLSEITSFGKEFLNKDNFSLMQNYPNPFNPITTISYSVKEEGFVQIMVYGVLGDEVATLVEEEKLQGNYSVKFDGNNLPSGVYMYLLRVNNFSDSKKMILLK
jgi:photosystem II stability/assembly factor-like uncharacterized protein